MASDYKLDLSAARKMVPVLSGAQLQQLSQRAAQAETALSGGDTVTISTTVIIIVLLIVISFWLLDVAYRDGGSVRNDVAGREPGDSERILAVARGF